MALYPEKAYFRVTEEMKAYLDNMEGSSEFLRRLVYDVMNDTDSIKRNIHELEEQNDYYMQKVKENNLIIKSYKEQLKRAEELRNFRPEAYKDSVETLLRLDHVQDKDFIFQSNRCKVPVDTYKKWLYDDGVYDKLLS